MKQRQPPEWKCMRITIISASLMRLGLRRCLLPSCGAPSIDFSCCASKNLQNSSAKQKISVILSSENIAVRCCFTIDCNLKLQNYRYSPNFQWVNLELIKILISNSRYFTNYFVFFTLIYCLFFYICNVVNQTYLSMCVLD